MTQRALEVVAVTGATGFVGDHLVRHLLDQGAAVRALARAPEKLTALKNHAPAGRLTVIKGDLDDGAALAEMAKGADVTIHLAARTHAMGPEEFHAANVRGAAAAAAATRDAGGFFVHISSIAARHPLSDYAKSKADSETAVLGETGADGALILRAPAIYGPGDMATLPFFKMVRLGIAPEPASATPAMASILYVGDLVAAIEAAARDAAPGETYEIGDDSADGRAWTEIGATLGAVMGKKPLRFRAPRALLLAQAMAAETIGKLRGEATFVSRSKVDELFHPDWVARHNLLSEATDWTPRTSLSEGFETTLRWYRDEGHL